MAGLGAILDAMADKVRNAIDGIDWEIQVEPWLVINPSPLTVDMFPADPATDEDYAGFGDLEGARVFTVRARTNTPDADGARDALLALMDIEDEHSIVVALSEDQTLFGLATSVDVRGGSGLLVFPSPDGVGGLLGVQWNVLVIGVPGAVAELVEHEYPSSTTYPGPTAYPGIYVSTG